MHKKTVSPASRVLAGISMLASLVGALAVNIWALPCQGTLELANGNMTPMRCLYTEKIATLLFIVAFLVALWALLARKDAGLVLVVLAAALVLITFESAIGIGVCKTKMMCWTMATWIRICAGVVGACGIAGLGIGLSGRQVK
ncbi:MAG: DUF4418 family protein [Eggerthellaceae bacterium]|nr:DUF4418 family protein [Eggerthellaceae bacterium]